MGVFVARISYKKGKQAVGTEVSDGGGVAVEPQPPETESVEIPEVDPEPVEPDLTDDPAEAEEGVIKGRTKTGLPLPPGKRVKPEVLFEWLKKFGDRDWAHTTIYVNDMWPVCTKKFKYIAKLDRLIDLEYFKQVLGSGDYDIFVNDDAIHSQRRTVCFSKLRLRDPAYPPKRFLEQVAMNDPANQEYVDQLKREGLVRVVNGRNELMQNGSAPVHDSAVAMKLTDALIASKSAPAKDPMFEMLSAQIESSRKEAAETRKLLFEMMAKPAPPVGDNGTSLMLQILQSQLVAANGQIMALQQQKHEIDLATINRKPDAAAAAGRGMSVKEYLELEETIEHRLVRRNSTGEKDEWWVGLAKEVAPAVSQFAQAYASRVATPAPGEAPSLAPRPQLVPRANAGDAPPGAVDPAAEALEAEYAACIETMRSHGSHLVGAVQHGVKGDAFAQGLIAKVGRGAYDAVAKYGPDMLHDAVLDVPELAAQIGERGQELSDFVDAFCAFGAPGPVAVAEPVAQEPVA